MFSDCLSDELDLEQESVCNMASCEFDISKPKFGVNFD